MAVRLWNVQAVKMLVDLGADTSVVKADEKGAIILERSKNEAEKISGGSRRGVRGVRVTPLFLYQTEARRAESKKKLRQSPSSTTKEIED